MNKKRKITIQMIILVSALLFIMIAFVSFSQKNKIRISKQNMDYVQDNTIQLSRYLEAVMEEGIDSIKALSAFCSASLVKDEIDIEVFREITKETNFDFIEITDAYGNDYNITGGISDASDRQYYLDGIQGNTGVEVVYDSRATHETLIMFYAPVSYQGENVGVIVGVYQAANKLAKLLAKEYYGSPAKLYLCNEDGTIIATNHALEEVNKLLPRNMSEIYEDQEFIDQMENAIRAKETMTFTFGSSDTIACVTNLSFGGWYLVQIFPDDILSKLVRDANRDGAHFENILIAIFLIVIITLIIIYQKERKTIQEEAARSSNYKNAVLAGAIIAYEANLTKNQIIEGAWAGTEKNAVPVNEILGITLPYAYDKYISMWNDRFVEEKYKKVFLEENDKQHLLEEFQKGNSEISFDYLTESIDNKNILARRSIYLTKDAKTGDVIAYCNVKDITEQKRKEESLILASRSDELTKCLNRNAFEEDIANYRNQDGFEKIEDNFVIMSIDVNGLKVVNDNEGHAAGDELLCAAANCLKRCLGGYGKVYRTGGDEFMAIIYVDDVRLKEIQKDIEQTALQWHGINGMELSFSYGFVTKRELQQGDLNEMLRLADERMYAMKEKHYKDAGIDRKGQQIAFEVLRKHYLKILKVNLTEDTYSEIQTDSTDGPLGPVFSKIFSEAVAKDHIHPEDVEHYLNSTKVEKMREAFDQGLDVYHVHYRRKVQEIYKNVMMEVMRAPEYTKEQQVVFVFIKNIEG